MPRVAYAKSDESRPAEGRKNPVRIAIVEDDYLVSREIEAALEDAGFEIVGIAISADEAIALVASARPALAIMDIRLNGARDGIDAALEMFARYGIRCVFATAHHTPDTRVRAEPARPLAWVPKPYVMPMLVDAVRQAVQRLDEQK
jgi:DNA-binding NarL/FixJ family response regulator